MFQNGLGNIHQGLSTLGDALLDPLRLADFAVQVILYFLSLRLLSQPPVVAVDGDGGVHGLIQQNGEGVLKLYNSYVRDNVAQLLPAGEGNSGLGV